MLCSTNFVSVFLVFLNKRGEAPMSATRSP